jgi:hypothetical protein
VASPTTTLYPITVDLSALPELEAGCVILTTAPAGNRLPAAHLRDGDVFAFSDAFPRVQIVTIRTPDSQPALRLVYAAELDVPLTLPADTDYRGAQRTALGGPPVPVVPAARPIPGRPRRFVRGS